MYQYILRRLLLTIPVVIGVSVIVFGIIRLLPGDPARALAGVQEIGRASCRERVCHRV